MTNINLKKIITISNIDNFRYEEIIRISYAKRAKYTIKNTDSNFLYKRAIEIIRTSPDYIYLETDNPKSKKNKLSNNLEKQLFMNNFVFNDNEKFINTLKTYNITNEQIKLLADEIKKAKIKALTNNNYELDISEILNINILCRHFNLPSKEFIIAKILELYYLQNDLLKQKVKKYQ